MKFRSLKFWSLIYRPFSAMLILGLAQGLFCARSFAPYNYPLLVWIAPWPLFYFSRRFKNQIHLLILSGALSAVFFCIFSFYWLFEYLYTLGQLSFLNRAIIFILYALIANLKFSLFILLFGLSYRNVFRSLLPARWFTAGVFAFLSDYISPQIFPWYWGNLLAGNNILAQLTEYTGIHGLSFLLFAVSFWLYRMVLISGKLWAQNGYSKTLTFTTGFIRKILTSRFYRRRLLPVPFFLILCFVFGFYVKRQVASYQQSLPVLRVGILQPNTPLKMYGDDEIPQEKIRQVMDHTIPDLSEQAGRAAHEKLDLLVLPESAIPYYSTQKNAISLKEDIYSKDFEQMVKRLSSRWNANVFLSEVAVAHGDTSQEGNATINYYNSSVLYSREGNRRGSYHKRILTVAENIPGAGFLKRTGLIAWVPEEIRLPFSSGNTSNLIAYDMKQMNRPVQVNAASLCKPKEDQTPNDSGAKFHTELNFDGDGHFLPLICYEILFPAHIRTFFKNTEIPDFFVNIVQDGWFGHTIETFQHYELARVRAIEFRRALVRSTNSGTSGFVDLSGNYVTPLAGPVFTKQYAQDFQVWDVPISRAPPTVYARMGDLWMLFVFLLFLGSVGFGCYRRKYILDKRTSL